MLPVDIPNTFAPPNCKNKMFSVASVLQGLRIGAWKMEDLPDEVRERVIAYKKKIHVGNQG